jgi:hypothetical protein
MSPRASKPMKRVSIQAATEQPMPEERGLLLDRRKREERMIYEGAAYGACCVSHDLSGS